jgi:hypothetical protein
VQFDEAFAEQAWQSKERFEKIFNQSLRAYGDYEGEQIKLGGSPRKPQHWENDLSEYQPKYLLL